MAISKQVKDATAACSGVESGDDPHARGIWPLRNS